MQQKPLRSILIVSFLFFAHFSIVMYINSTALERFVDAKYTSLLYVLGAIGSLVLLFVLPALVQAKGLVRTSIWIYLLLTITLVLLALATTPALFTTAFVLYSALTSTVWYCEDLFVAHYTETSSAGRTRGIYLTVINTAIALMPICTGLLVSTLGLPSVYAIAALFLAIAMGIIRYSQKTFVDRTYTAATMTSAWTAIRHSASLRRVLSINFLLQFFYVWMTIYAPLYMATVLHFTWPQIGAAFSFMLLPFVLMQYKVGVIADAIGEKAMLIGGFAIAAISTAAFGLLEKGTHSIVWYAIVLFLTRVGMCMVEVLSESYFFKQVSDQDESVVSVFRMMRPLSYVIAPLIGWYILYASSYSMMFILLGVALFAGMLYTFRLKTSFPSVQ